MKALLILLAILTFNLKTTSQIHFFNDLEINSLRGVQQGTVDFMDVNEDDFLDLFITGQDSENVSHADLYINNGSGGYDLLQDTPFTPVEYSSVSHGDVDSDGDTDIFVSGFGQGVMHSSLYFGDGSGNFVLSENNDFIKLRSGDSKFVDIDDDTDLDLVVTGQDEFQNKITRLYKNTGDGEFFEDVAGSFVGVFLSHIASADVDGDSDVDLLIIGRNSNGERTTILYLNDGTGHFIASAEVFTAINSGAVEFEDFDNDGDQDVILSGSQAGPDVTEIYFGNGDGTFSLEASTNMINVYNGDLGLEDVDLDGDIDVLVCGVLINIAACRLYLNNGDGEFIEDINNSFTGMMGGEIDFGDIDNDGDSDLAIVGLSEISEQEVRVYENSLASNGLSEVGENHFQFYPNPVEGILNIKGDESIKNVSVRGVDGRVVLSVMNPKGYIDVGDLSPGNYLLDIETKEGRAFKHSRISVLRR